MLERNPAPLPPLFLRMRLPCAFHQGNRVFNIYDMNWRIAF